MGHDPVVACYLLFKRNGGTATSWSPRITLRAWRTSTSSGTGWAYAALYLDLYGRLRDINIYGILGDGDLDGFLRDTYFNVTHRAVTLNFPARMVRRTSPGAVQRKRQGNSP